LESPQTLRPSSSPASPPVAGGGPAKSPRGEIIDVDANLKKLKSGDPEKRLEALRELEYSLDPRLPAVMLGLLKDSGDTIRRVAAHGIGSRWWQVPRDQSARYIAELKKSAAREEDNGMGECSRSIALLQQGSGSRIEFRKAVSISPNGRWIIYDRLGLPCLVDVQTQSEEMLGMESADREGRYWGNPESVLWHPSREAAAIPLATRRGTACLVAWGHRTGTRVLHKETVLKLIEKRRFKPNYMTSSFSEEKLKWRGDKLLVPVAFSNETADESDHVATVLWNPENGELLLETVK
jgi:hypothetical protein